MRVAVTGGAGFIGSDVIDAFTARGDDVLVVDDLSTGSERNLAAPVELAQVDVAREAELGYELARFRPDAICHLAAQSSVTVSVTLPELDFDSNTRGVFNVCRVAGTLRVPV